MRLLQSGQLQSLFGLFFTVAPGDAGVYQWQHHVAQHGGPGQQVEGLEHKADAGPPDVRELVVGVARRCPCLRSK